MADKRLTEDCILGILEDGDDPELYEDCEHLYNCYEKLGKIEQILEKHNVSVNELDKILSERSK